MGRALWGSCWEWCGWWQEGVAVARTPPGGRLDPPGWLSGVGDLRGALMGP